MKCEICGKAFSRNGDLTRHKVVHSGEKRFDCDICERSFGGRNNLTAHKVVHSGEKDSNVTSVESRLPERVI